MEKLNTLIKIAFTMQEYTKAAPKGGAFGGGIVGAPAGALLGAGIGGLTHLLKSDKGLSQDEKKERLKKYLKRGTLIGAGTGLVGGGVGGYVMGRRAKDILTTASKSRHHNASEAVKSRYRNMLEKKYPNSYNYAKALTEKSLKESPFQF